MMTHPASCATLLCALFFNCLSTTFAQDNGKKAAPVRLLIGGALELGGDKVAEVYFTNSNTQTVKAGQGGSVSIGAQYQFPKIVRLLLRASVGYKYVTTEADNVHIRLTRMPINLSANYLITEKLLVGAGLAMHRAIRFKADGIGKDLLFDAANGPRFEVAYAGIGISYTAMKYTDEQKYPYSANAVGISFTAVIPKM